MSKNPKRLKRRQEELPKNTRQNIVPQSINQQKYWDAIQQNQIIFCTGPAGCGKTLLALTYGIKLLLSGQIKKIIVVRPLVAVKNFGETKSIGAFPGSLFEKITMWLGSIFDDLELLISKEQLQKFVDDGCFEFTPLALCRGRTFSNCLVLIEECQNLSLEDDGALMLLTRLGNNAKIIFAGDLQQKDLSGTSALGDAIKRFKNMDQIGVVELEKIDIMRNPLIAKILEKYGK